jgi:hypothetical protein
MILYRKDNALNRVATAAVRASWCVTCLVFLIRPQLTLKDRLSAAYITLTSCTRGSVHGMLYPRRTSLAMQIAAAVDEFQGTRLRKKNISQAIDYRIEDDCFGDFMLRLVNNSYQNFVSVITTRRSFFRKEGLYYL